MSGSGKSLGPNQWQFVLSGAPPADPGCDLCVTN